jgi:hypothetical protein
MTMLIASTVNRRGQPRVPSCGGQGCATIRFRHGFNPEHLTRGRAVMATTRRSRRLEGAIGGRRLENYFECGLGIG